MNKRGDESVEETFILKEAKERNAVRGKRMRKPVRSR